MAVQMQVIVVGAGTAGLGAAIALRRAGHIVKVYERRPDCGEGNAMNLQGNVMRVLRQYWEINDMEDHGLCRMKETFSFNGLTLAEISRTVVKDGLPQDELYAGARSDFQRLLHYHAVRKDGLGMPVKIMFNKHVIEWDAENGAIKLADSDWENADLIVAADGVRSSAVEHIVGHKAPTHPTGRSVMNFLIPTEKSMTFADLEPVVLNAGERLRMLVPPEKPTEIVKPLARIFWVPAKWNQVQALNFTIMDNEEYAPNGELLVRLPKSAVAKELELFHPALQALSHYSEETFLWKICDREPLNVMSRARLVMIGDACHPMAPHRGQGGAQGIEDAAALGTLFANMPDIDYSTIVNRIKLFEDIRLPKVSAMQVFSNGDRWQGKDVERDLLKKAAKYFPGGQGPASAEEYREIVMGYDVVEDCRQQLARMNVAVI